MKILDCDIEELKRLHNGLGILDSFTPFEDEKVSIKVDDVENEELTSIFEELGNLNKRRQDIIKTLMNYETV